MANSKDNKDKIKKYMNDFYYVYDNYITQGKSTYKLAEEWELPKSTVYSITKAHGLVGIKQADKLNTCDETKFNSKDEVFCYLAGLTAADGYIDEKNHRVVLRLKYDEWYDLLNKLRDYFSVSNTVKEYKGTGSYAGEYRMADLTISSKVLIEELKKLNIQGRKKDLLRRFPDMQSLSDECQEMFMRGLLDGDGSIRENNGGFSILEESDLMMEAILGYINTKFRFNYTFLKEENNRGFKHLYIWKKDAQNFYEWLYRHNLQFKLQYKFEHALG